MKPSLGSWSRVPLTGPKVCWGLDALVAWGPVPPGDMPDFISARRLERMSYLMAKPIPWALRRPLLFIPTTSPLRLSRGPPLLPLFVAASVWTYETPP